VFGGVERGSGKTFLVAVPDRNVDTLTNVIHTWIEPGTTLISDCWTAYQDIESEGYSICFVKPETTLTPSSEPGVTLRLSSDLTIDGRTTSSTSHITCSRAWRNKCHYSLSSLPLSHPYDLWSHLPQII
jgi:hypothetical protein